MLVKAHCNGVPELAAGMKALPDCRSSFAHTQALWRFLHNEKVTPEKLGAPLIAEARDAVSASCDRYVLIAHDWSRLNYNTHSTKADRLRMTHDTDVGYELQSSLAIGDRNGDPLAPVAQNLVTAKTTPPAVASSETGVDDEKEAKGKTTLSSYHSNNVDTVPHLDELTERIGWLEKSCLGKPLLHMVDREGDSVDHLRQWTAGGHRWLVRARGYSNVRVPEGNQRLDDLAKSLAYHLAREVEHKGQPCRQWIAETPVVLARRAKPKRMDANGKRVPPKRGEPIGARLVVSRIEDMNGLEVASWYLLTNLEDEVDAATVALWYYFRWRIECFFKLLKQAGQQLEQWEQESGPAIFKRLLIASQACVLTWRIMREKGEFAEQARQFLVRLSGRQTKRIRPVTAPSVLSGLHMLFAMLEVLEYHSIEELRDIARFAFPGTEARRI